MLNVLKIVSIAFLAVMFFSSNVSAMTPEDYCELHEDSGAPGACTPSEDCVILTTNLGTQECKLCEDGGCSLTDCSNCPEE